MHGSLPNSGQGDEATISRIRVKANTSEVEWDGKLIR